MRAAEAYAQPTTPAHAAAPAQPVPHVVLDLDTAVLALFDAAEARRWDDAHKAIASAQSAARSLRNLEASYSEAGGETSRFFTTTDQLSADLIDASAAASVRDQPWLVSTADNLLARAGDLTEPYVSRIEAAAPRLEVLLVLARRMRQAPVWENENEFDDARRAFDLLWPSVRDQLDVRRPQLVVRVDAARAGILVSPSSTNAGDLYAAVRNLLGALPVA